MIFVNKVLSLQVLDSKNDIELRAGSSLSISCKVISTLSVAVC
ncbi:class III lanthipeptide [Peribacillus frigoritolerans]